MATTNSRPALVLPDEESQAAKEMSATLKDISVWNLKAQMTAAKIPGAEHIDWKEDLIALAVQYKFSYVFRRGLSLPPKQQSEPTMNVSRTAAASVHPAQASTADVDGQFPAAALSHSTAALAPAVAAKRVTILAHAPDEQVAPPQALNVPALTCVADSVALIMASLQFIFFALFA